MNTKSSLNLPHLNRFQYYSSLSLTIGLCHRGGSCSYISPKPPLPTCYHSPPVFLPSHTALCCHFHHSYEFPIIHLHIILSYRDSCMFGYSLSFLSCSLNPLYLLPHTSFCYHLFLFQTSFQ